MRGVPTRALSRALADSAHRFAIPRELFEEIIAGVEMDLSTKRYQTFAELRPYCYRVASALGLICIEIFGYRNPSAKLYAENLGLALQLTNILRDVREDASVAGFIFHWKISRGSRLARTRFCAACIRRTSSVSWTSKRSARRNCTRRRNRRSRRKIDRRC